MEISEIKRKQFVFPIYKECRACDMHMEAKIAMDYEVGHVYSPESSGLFSESAASLASQGTSSLSPRKLALLTPNDGEHEYIRARLRTKRVRVGYCRYLVQHHL